MVGKYRHNIGSEEDGKGPTFARPVLIVRKFNRELFYGLPLSTTQRTGRYYHPIVLNGVENRILLTHLRSFSSKRLINKISVMRVVDFHAVVADLMGTIVNSTP